MLDRHFLGDADCGCILGAGQSPGDRRGDKVCKRGKVVSLHFTVRATDTIMVEQYLVCNAGSDMIIDDTYMSA
jgi:hypothetical protein